MTSPMPEPSPTPTPLPGGVKPFAPSGGALPKPPNATSTTSGGGNALTGTVTKGVWFMRPTPLFTNTSNLEGIKAASDWSQPNINQWYDKSDVEGQFTSLAYTDQLLFEAVAKSIGSRNTGTGLFKDMVDKSAYLSTQGIRKTPQQLLYEIAYERGVLKPDGTFDAAAAKAASQGKSYGTTSASTKDTSTKLTDKDTARGLVDTALETYLGRRASEEETSAFIKALHQHENKNPTVTVQSGSTTTSPGGSSTTRSSKTKGGSNSQQFAEDWARGQEGAAEFQAASTYLDEFMKVLQNPMDVVG